MPRCRRCQTEVEWWDLREGVCDDCRADASRHALKKFLADKEKEVKALEEQVGCLRSRLLA